MQNLKATFASGINSISGLLKAQQFSFGDSFNNTLASDIAALENYQAAIDNGSDSYTAYQQTMLGASAAAKEFTKTGEAANVVTTAFTKQQNLAQVTTVATNKSLSSCSSLISEYNSAIGSADGLTATAKVTQAEFATAVGESNKSLGKYLSGLNGAEASTTSYITSLVGAKVATVVLRAATMALNMALTMGVSAAVTSLINWVSELWVTEDELAEKVSEVTEEYKNQQQTLSSTKTTIDSLSSKYATLSNGVDGLNNNVSLSSDEYDEYLEICNEIADLIPSLVIGYDEQGNAILSCKGNVEELTAAYNELAIAANNALLTEGSDIFEDFRNQVIDSSLVNPYDTEMTTYTVKTLREILESDDIESAINPYRGTSFLEQITAALEDAGIERDTGDWWNAYDDETDADFIARAIKENRTVVEAIVSDYESQMSEACTSMASVTQAYISNALLSGSYDGISDNMQTVLNQVIGSWNYDFYSQFDSLDELYSYITGVLDNFNNLSSDDQNAIELAFNAKTEFNNGECTVGEYLDKMNDVDDAISGLDEDSQSVIKLLLNDDDITTKINELNDKLAEGVANGDLDIGDAVGSKTNFLNSYYDEIVEAEELEKKRKEVLDNLWSQSPDNTWELDNGAKEELEEQINSLSEEDLEIACKVMASTDINSFSELEKAIANYEPVEKISFSDLMAEEDTDEEDSFSTKVDTYVEKVTELQDVLEKYRDGDFENEDFLDLIDEYPDLAYEADNLDGAIESLISDMNNDIASEFSSQFNRLETDEDVAALQNYEDAVLELGQVVGTTEFSIDIDTEIDGMENLWSAMKESVSATGLTADSVEELTNRYKDLDNFDAASLFEKTSNGIHLNTKALRELESAYEEQKKSDIDGTLEDLVSQYNDLTKEINNCSDAATTAELYSQRADILEQIEDTSALAAEYEGLTSAFNKWEEAQSIGEEGDMYDSLAEGLENIKELYDEGLVGTNEFRAAVQLMSNEDLSTASIDELLAAYESGYSTMTRYFSDSSDGCLNFLNDLQELNSEWVSMNEDGSWDINFGMGNDQEIADALGINVESVQSILRKLSDYGFEINLDSIYSNLDLLKSYAEEANDSLKELGKTDYTFNFETDDIDYVNEQIEVAQTLLDEFKDEDGTVNLGLEGAEEAQTVLISLISQKQSLSAPAVMSVDTTALSDINPDLAAAIAALQEFVQYTNDLEIEIKTGADTADTQTKLQEVSGKLNSLSEETKIAIGIDGEEFSAALQSITNTDVNVEAGVNINQEDIDSVQAAINGINVEDITMTTNADSITSELTAIDEYTIDNKNFVVTVSDYATIKLASINSYLSTLPTSKTIVVTTKTQTVGSGSAQGTAYASGSWGTKSSGVGLGGELGEELVRL